MKKQTRAIMRIDLLPATKELFLEVAERQGMTQLAVTSRIVEWFCKQSEEIQHGVLQSGYKNNAAEVAKLAMQKFTS